MTQIHYLLCGHGKLEKELHQLAKELGISHMVTFAGYREDMLEILQTADIFLFPSYQEGLPMALLEAMASGLPVICSDIRGSQDLMGEVLSQTDTAKVCSGGIMIKKADDVSAYSQATVICWIRRITCPPVSESWARTTGVSAKHSAPIPL